MIDWGTCDVHETAVVEVGARIGKGTVVGALAHIATCVTIGDYCEIGPGAKLGQDGFGYVDEDGTGEWTKKEHGFGVIVGDSVHIGANTCVDRGSWRDTVLLDGCKIDNLCHIAHNCIIGRNAMVVAGAEVSGSVEVGWGAWISPNACIRQRLKIGEEALVGIGAVVVKDVPAGETHVGNPAKKLAK